MATPRRVIDVSVPNGAGQHVYPGDPEPRIEAVRRIAQGDVCNLSLLHMGTHTGTHVDAPFHFLADGARLGEVPLDRMVGPCVVADLRGRGEVDAAALRDVPVGPGEILVRTRACGICTGLASPSRDSDTPVTGCARRVAHALAGRRLRPHRPSLTSPYGRSRSSDPL